MPPRPFWWFGTALSVISISISLMLSGTSTGARFDGVGLGLCLAVNLAYAGGITTPAIATCLVFTMAARRVTAFVLAIIVVGEPPGAAALGGLGLVLAGLWLVVRMMLSTHGHLARQAEQHFQPTLRAIAQRNVATVRLGNVARNRQAEAGAAGLAAA